MGKKQKIKKVNKYEKKPATKNNDEKKFIVFFAYGVILVISAFFEDWHNNKFIMGITMSGLLIALYDFFSALLKMEDEIVNLHPIHKKNNLKNESLFYLKFFRHSKNILMLGIVAMTITSLLSFIKLSFIQTFVTFMLKDIMTMGNQLSLLGFGVTILVIATKQYYPVLRRKLHNIK